MAVARRKTFHGVSVGILMVKTGFRRLPGDVGHAGTWDFPVQYRVVESATPDKMMALQASGLLDDFKAAALDLIAGGVDGIATTCGFLALFQRELAEACSVPVATSSLLQVPLAERLLPAGKRVGILTFSSENLHAAHLEAVGRRLRRWWACRPIRCSSPRSSRATSFPGSRKCAPRCWPPRRSCCAAIPMWAPSFPNAAT